MAKKKENDLKQLAEQYAKIVAEEAKLKGIKENVQAMIKESMQIAGADKIETNFGNFTIYKRATWKYSPDIEAEYTALKEREKIEQESGEAVATFSESLRFTPIKIKS